ncbi:ABC transporter permease [Micromonospora endophytica]|uniref:ABC transporter permease n=1 Tax=Micromonospora endophytica TaxID=515350 RepID=A0A2W2CNX6_9ACTN|nr:ABC transporter permease [Micromonospora endophytica]PZG01202.1 ABC transporter permease [Micromonospora endophytica]RIW45857.1 ABC transporter permease [Micromonospora endophytica]BCJ61872.1 ABC transporter permease [Micromonospora endophytica]
MRSRRAAIGGRLLVRLATSVMVLWGAVTVSFCALHLTPGSVEDALVGTTIVTPEVRAQIAVDYGLDRPLLVQYGAYLGRVVSGDLGYSYQRHESVVSAIGAGIGPSLQLAGAGMALALVVATVSALTTAGRARWIRGLASGAELVGTSVPMFWVGILLLTVFSFQLGWMPAVGGDGLTGLVLPAISMAIPVGALLSQVMREGLERVLQQPFALTARARGMSDGGVRLRHALRHALLPVITLAGWLFGMLLGAMVVTEKVFSRPGLGVLMLDAVHGKDLPVVMGVVLVSATVYVVVNTGLDLIYPVIDPRLREAT